MAKITPAISSRMPAANSRRTNNCSILDIPFCAKIVLHPVDIPGTNCNVPQGLSHCSGRHRRIQRHRKQCRPHLVGNLVFRHKDPQTLQPLGGVQSFKFDPRLFSPKNQSQKIHRKSFPVSKRRRAACFHKFCSASLRLASSLMIRFIIPAAWRSVPDTQRSESENLLGFCHIPQILPSGTWRLLLRFPPLPPAPTERIRRF